MKKVKLILLNPFNDLKSYENRPMQEAKFFKEIGCEVEVLILQRKVLGNEVINNTIEGIKIKHFLCKTEKMSRQLEQNSFIRLFKPFIHIWWLLRFMKWLRSELKKDSGSYLLSHNIEMAVATCLMRTKKNTHVFVMREFYEGQMVKPWKKWLVSHLSQFAQNQSEYLIHVVPYQMDVTKVKNRKKVLYIPNYPSQENYKNVKKTESSKLRINYIGCVRDVKSLKMLMDAAVGIDKVEIGIHGDGEAYSYLKGLQKKYRNVQVTGYYDYRTETETLFSNSDIIYCAYDITVSNWKIAYPIKLYEAIETNTPVLLCKGMAPEQFVIDHDFGFVFQYDKEDLRKCILKICSEREILDKKVSKMKNVENPYTWEKVVGNYKKIFTYVGSEEKSIDRVRTKI